MYVYGSMDEDIKAFGVYKIAGSYLKPMPEIQSILDKQFSSHHLHHYIKAQQYARNRQWFEDRGIKNKLIFMPALMHEHLESPINGLTNEAFYRKYRIHKQMLLFNKREYLEEDERKKSWEKLLKKS